MEILKEEKLSFQKVFTIENKYFNKSLLYKQINNMREWNHFTKNQTHI